MNIVYLKFEGKKGLKEEKITQNVLVDIHDVYLVYVQEQSWFIILKCSQTCTLTFLCDEVGAFSFEQYTQQDDLASQTAAVLKI